MAESKFSEPEAKKSVKIMYKVRRTVRNASISTVFLIVHWTSFAPCVDVTSKSAKRLDMCPLAMQINDFINTFLIMLIINMMPFDASKLLMEILFEWFF